MKTRTGLLSVNLYISRLNGPRIVDVDRDYNLPSALANQLHPEQDEATLIFYWEEKGWKRTVTRVELDGRDVPHGLSDELTRKYVLDIEKCA